MVTLISHSPQETAGLGEHWGRAAASGWVIGLTGDLGAGKTELVKGIARGLGVLDRVHSPTFVLVNQYSGGRLTLFHLDLYRLESRDQIAAAGLDDYLFQPSGLAVIEWAERWFQPMRNAECQPSAGAHRRQQRSGMLLRRTAEMPGLPPRYRRVQIETLNETERRITYEDFGA
jgi:tRNA threonylcarbamoyladenosine biosynthesis protein TsaE